MFQKINSDNNEKDRGTRRKSTRNEIEDEKKEALVWRVSFKGLTQRDSQMFSRHLEIQKTAEPGLSFDRFQNYPQF